MNNRVFHITGFIIFVLYAMHGAEIYATPTVKNSPRVECGQKHYQNSGLDNLATELAKITQVNRIQESIDIRIPEQKIFDNVDSTLSRDGKMFLTRLAGDLTCYPDTMIYIEENSSSSPADIYHAEAQLFRVQTLFREDGIDINRLDVDLATPPDDQQVVQAGKQQAKPADFVELKIIPRV
jgi:hypothetical protein